MLSAIFLRLVDYGSFLLLVLNVKVGGTILRGYVDELLPILLEFLGDASSSQKREVSLWTLSQLVESTGCVVEPYNKHPQVNTLSPS